MENSSNATSRTIRRLARSHTKHTKAVATMSNAYTELLSVYTDIIGLLRDEHANGNLKNSTLINAATTMEWHNKAMTSVENFRNGIKIAAEADSTPTEKD